MNSQTQVPTHVGLILDGNRRWAKERGMVPQQGHLEGYKVLKNIVDNAFNKGVKYVTAYVFSTENWKRTQEEVGFLMDLAFRLVVKDLKEIQDKNIRVLWLGSTDRVSDKLQKALKHAEDVTKDNTAGTLCLGFNYGGRSEIVDAAAKAAAKGEVTEQTITENLYGGSDVPAVDLVIRTSGEHRISNFMLWRSAYSELFFTDVLWPDFSTDDLDEALAHYASRQRRYGE